MLELIMRVLSFRKDRADIIIAEALSILNKGGIVAYPTESFYALGVLATDIVAVKKLFELKKRPADKPLPIIIGDSDILLSIVKSVPDQAKDLITRYWPGPLTIIFEAQDNVPALLTGWTGKVAVRIPGEGIALDLAKSLKMPVTATSANLSASRPAETSEEVINYFRESVDLIIDAGEAPGGMPSTIIDVTVVPPVVLREGRVSLNNIKLSLKAEGIKR